MTNKRLKDQPIVIQIIFWLAMFILVLQITGLCALHLKIFGIYSLAREVVEMER